jgi:hypothetical protein
MQCSVLLVRCCAGEWKLKTCDVTSNSNLTQTRFLGMGGLPRRLSSTCWWPFSAQPGCTKYVRVPVLERKRNSVRCAITDATMTCTNRLTDGKEWLHECAFGRQENSPQFTWSKRSVRTWVKLIWDQKLKQFGTASRKWYPNSLTQGCVQKHLPSKRAQLARCHLMWKAAFHTRSTRRECHPCATAVYHRYNIAITDK